MTSFRRGAAMIARCDEVIDLTDRAGQLEAENARQAQEIVRLIAENEELRSQYRSEAQPELFVTDWACCPN